MSEWNKKVVVVTGGSDGLGLAIVCAFAERGATVVSLARNQDKNVASLQPLVDRNLSVVAISADVTIDASVVNAVREIEQQFGSIDVWVNNVGKSTRADVMKAGVEDYQQIMELNFYTAVRCWIACRANLIKSSGQLVNIGSLASKTAWPFMSPYSASKHALSAFSHQLRLEGPANVNVLHICPGPIKRTTNEIRYAAESQDLPDVAKQAGAGARVKGVSPQVIAAKIILGCEKRKGELVIPWSARLLFSISQLSSGIGDFLVRRFVTK